MLGQNPSIVVVFIDRNRLQFYSSRLPDILTLEVPATFSKDLDIVNKDGFYTLVNQWLKQNNLGGSQLFFVLSPMTYFERIIPPDEESRQETDILSFYNSVPFEELATRVLIIGGKKHAVAVNRDFIESIRHAFMFQGYHVIAVVPAVLLGTLAAKRWLDKETGAFVVKHIETLVAQNIVESEEQSVVAPASHVPTEKNNPRLMIMVSIFGVLLLALIVLLFTHH
jgi:hypothetical protein